MHSDKYVGILITLDVIGFLIIILLAISASRAYKFMAHKDRILLFHFIFLEASLFCNNILNKLTVDVGKTISLLFGAMYSSSTDLKSDYWV